MAMNFTEAGSGLSPQEAAKYANGIQKMTELASSLQSEGLLPASFESTPLASKMRAEYYPGLNLAFGTLMGIYGVGIVIGLVAITEPKWHPIINQLSQIAFRN